MVGIPCALCRASCTSFLTLADHVLGQKHRALVASVSPEEVHQLGRLQYFITTYMKGVPVLGLECVVERKPGSSYTYACTLCKVEKNFPGMVGHITSVEHMQKYIYTHYRHLHDPTEYPTKASQLRALGSVATSILNNSGNKEIRLKSNACSRQDLDTVSGHSSEEGGINNGTLPAVDDALQTEYAQEGPMDNSAKQMLECSESNEKKHLYFCNLCNKNFRSPYLLGTHVLGIKHYKLMLLKAHKQVNELKSLKFILNTYLMEAPILGLEYISELKEDSFYIFSCQLCNVESNLQIMVNHILGVEHTECYIKKHHANMFSPYVYKLKKGKRLKALRDISMQILKRYGRKEIMLKNVTLVDSAVLNPLQGGDTKTSKASEDKEADKLLYKQDIQSSSQAKRRPSPCQELDLDKSCKGNSQVEMVKKSEIDGPSLAKRSRLLPEEEQDALPSILGYDGSQRCMTSKYVSGLECTTAEQGFEFRTNDNFYEYLANFEIKDNRDAFFIQKVAKNCLQALKYFQEEEANKLKSMYEPEASPANTSGSSQDTVDMTVSKTESHSSGSKATLPKDASNPPIRIPQNEATDFSKATLPKHTSDPRLGIPGKEATAISKVVLPKQASNPPLGIKQNETTNIAKATLPKHTSNPTFVVPRKEATAVYKSVLAKHVLNPPLGIPENETTNIAKATFPELASNSTLVVPRKEATAVSKAAFPNQASNSPLGIPQNEAPDVSQAALPKHDSNPSLQIPQNKATEISKATLPTHASNPIFGIPKNEATHVSKTTLPKHASNLSLQIPQNEATDVSKASLPAHASDPLLGIPQNEASKFFFNNIKNMNESEVVAIFEKIATMNPEFQEMNIPTVIRYLKKSGILKKN